MHSMKSRNVRDEKMRFAIPRYGENGDGKKPLKKAKKARKKVEYIVNSRYDSRI